jgi:RNA polymerase-interacting CarD/CdnL/TRCF family regulator
MSTERMNPFADVEALPTFTPKAKTVQSVATEQIDQIAAANGFPSRSAGRTPSRRAGRRYKTGRNQQINIKATAQVIARLYQMADARQIPLGELLEKALEALQRKP